jgi:hypothetical protein
LQVGGHRSRSRLLGRRGAPLQAVSGIW